MLLATFVVSWVLAVNQWLEEEYGWRTAIPCGIFGGILFLVDWRTIFGTLIGFGVMALVGYAFIVGYDPPSPRFFKAMLVVTSFGGAAGSSINAIVLRRRLIGGIGLMTSIVSFCVILVMN